MESPVNKLGSHDKSHSDPTWIVEGNATAKYILEKTPTRFSKNKYFEIGIKQKTNEITF